MTKNIQLDMLNEKKENPPGPVTCLGMTFANDEERRKYFTEELRRKLPELKKIEGFPIGEDEDILALSDPPYYTACPNPFINDFIEEWQREKEELYGGEEEDYHREPFAADVSEGKNDPIYNAHSYHTKVPHKAIMRYILHYTKPGDIVFDGFCGTGMTGVAAQMCGDKEVIESLGYKVDKENNIINENGLVVSKIGFRRSILNDLSPVASFISYNYNNPIDANDFEKDAQYILDKVNSECEWMYRTTHSDKKSIGMVNYTVWSDVFICPECLSEIVFYYSAVDEETGTVKKYFNCDNCDTKLTKRILERVWVNKYDATSSNNIMHAKQVPVLNNYSFNGKNYNKKIDEDDLALLNKIDESGIKYWFPKNLIPYGDKTVEPIRLGFTDVSHLYTKRALITLSATFQFLKSINDKNWRYLLYTFEQAIMGFAKIARYVPTHYSQVNQYLSGTLYIGSQVVDVSLQYILANKIKRLTSLLKMYNNKLIFKQIISTQASQKFDIKKENFVDYIFMDPPFGSNLMYSELNFLWESWLKVFTNNGMEAIENKTQGKTLDNYKELMVLCFKEAYRILKPGRWITVEFSNSKASVWNAIQESIQKAGFIIANVSALDKKQGSFNSITSTTAVKQDLVISAYKPSKDMESRIKKVINTLESIWAFIGGHLKQLPVFIGRKGEAVVVTERTPRILFDRMVAYHVQNNLPVPISSAEFQAGVAQRFPMRDGMVFLESQVAEYDKKRILVKEFTQMSLFVSDENSAIEWLRQQLLKKPQTRQDLHPDFMKEIQHIAKYEKLPELDQLLEQNFLRYDGDGPVPSQIHSYLSTNYDTLRNLGKEDPTLQAKAKHRWYVPDPNKQADLEKLREKSLLREFASYLDEMNKSKKKLKQFRLEAIRAGVMKAWKEKDYQTIVLVGERLPEQVVQEDDKLLMYIDNAQIRLGM